MLRLLDPFLKSACPCFAVRMQAIVFEFSKYEHVITFPYFFQFDYSRNSRF